MLTRVIEFSIFHLSVKYLSLVYDNSVLIMHENRNVSFSWNMCMINALNLKLFCNKISKMTNCYSAILQVQQ